MVLVESISPDLKKKDDPVDGEFMWDVFGKAWEEELKASNTKSLEIWRAAVIIFLVGILSYGPVSDYSNKFLGAFSTIVKLLLVGVTIWILFYSHTLQGS